MVHPILQKSEMSWLGLEAHQSPSTFMFRLLQDSQRRPSLSSKLMEAAAPSASLFQNAGTVASYGTCQEAIRSGGFIPRLEELSQSRDRTLVKYAGRVLQRLDQAGAPA